MAREISLRINAKDDATANIKKVVDSVKSLGGVAKAAFAVFAAEKVIGFFSQALSAASAGDAGVKQSMQGITDAFTGFQVSLVKNITGNKAFMASIERLLNAVGPLVEKLIVGLVPILVTLSEAAIFAANAISKYLGPVFAAMQVVAAGAAISVKALFQALTGDLSGAKKTLTELEGIGGRIKDAFDADVTPITANYRTQGAQVRRNTDAAKNKPVDANKAADDEFTRLVKLRELDALRGGELETLATKEAAYRIELTKSTLSAERRLQVLDLLKTAGEFAKKQADEEKKSLDERTKGYKALEDAQKAQLDALIALAQKGKATATDRATLQRELDDARTAAEYASNPVDRNRNLDDADRIGDALKPVNDGIRGLVGTSAQELSAFIGDTFGNGLLAGFQTAFSSAASGNIGGAIRGFFAGISGAMGAAITQLGAETITALATKFIKTQITAFMTYGKIMKGLTKFLANPWTAGFAAVAIGVALSGLSRSLGASAGGGVGGAPVFSSGLNNTTQIANQAGGTLNVYVDGGFVNFNDPSQRQQWQDAIRDANGRNINIFSR
jgi:predicted DNA-binding protein (UPF0251 family)